MEQTAFILIILCLVLLVTITGLLSLLIYRLLKHPIPMIGSSSRAEAENKNEKSFQPAILERFRTLEALRPKRSELFCPNHPDEPGEVSCAICDHIFCRNCIRPFKTMHFCKEHLSMVMRHTWSEVLTLKTSTSDPENGVRLYEVKKVIFEKEGLPSYIETHYKINIDQDYIETYLVLFTLEDRVAELREKLINFQS